MNATAMLSKHLFQKYMRLSEAEIESSDGLHQSKLKNHFFSLNFLGIENSGCDFIYGSEVEAEKRFQKFVSAS